MPTPLELKLIFYIRWTARIISSLLLAFFIFIIIAHVFSDEGSKFVELPFREQAILSLLLLEMVGLGIAWKWEIIGAVVTLAAHILFQVLLGGIFATIHYATFPILAIMFLYCGVRSSKETR